MLWYTSFCYAPPLYQRVEEIIMHSMLNCRLGTVIFFETKLVSWSLTTLFSTNIAVSEIKRSGVESYPYPDR